MAKGTIPHYTRFGALGGGLIAAIIAGLAMGLVMHFGAGLIELLGGLAPVPGESVVLGWAVHMLISVGFGLVFAAGVSRKSVCRQVRAFSDVVLAGLVYGAFIGILAGGVVFPVAMARAEVTTLPLPFLPIPGAAGEFLAAIIFAIGHLVYGIVLGTTFATINGITPTGRFERFAVLD